MFKTADLIKDTPHPKASGTLLKEAQEYMYKNHKWTYPLEELKDEHGTYSYRYKQGVLVAKKKTMYDIVSIHRKVLGQAIYYNLYVYFYLSRILYKISPEDIIRDQIKSNTKGEAHMINFNVRKLKRVN